MSRRPGLDRRRNVRGVQAANGASFIDPLTLSPIRWFESTVGCAVGLWEDQSISGVDYSNANAPTQPDKIDPDADFNGLPSLDFIAANDDTLVDEGTTADLNDLHDGSGGTFVALFKHNDLSTNQTLFGTQGTFSALNRGMTLRLNNQTLRYYVSNGVTAGIDVTSGAATIVDGHKGILVVRMQTAGYDVSWKGSSILSGTPGTLTGLDANSVGRLCRASATIQGCDAKIAAWGVFPSYLTDPQVADLRAYLINKYGAES